ncbi:unnamed protein product, partial [Linum tenue]
IVERSTIKHHKIHITNGTRTLVDQRDRSYRRCLNETVE